MAMATPASRRLTQDLKRIKTDPPAGISAEPSEESVMIWHAIIFGPAQTPFEDGIFKLTLEFSEDYPNVAPKVTFDNPEQVFHPNVYETGEICLDVLEKKWSPTFDVANILTAIQALLSDPNPESPANDYAAELYNEDMDAYEDEVRKCITKFSC